VIATLQGKTGLLALCLALLSACSEGDTNTLPPLAANPDPRPDIVLVVADDMRWDLQSARGHEFLNTPAMDALATEGSMMENAFVPMALCSPSRGAILTGRDVHQSSAPRIAWRNNSFLETQKTFAEFLQDAGYKTAYIGKWHLGDGSKPKKGFDHWESFDWLGDFFNPEIHVNGVATQHFGYVDDILADRAGKFIAENRDSDEPLFLMVGLKAPHLQFEHPERYKNSFDEVDIPRPDTFNEDFSVSGKLQSIKDWLGIDKFHCGLNCFNDSWSQYIKFHYRAILGLDDSIGTIRDATNIRAKQDNTLFIYTSDNGYSLGDHGLTEKHYVYEEPVRVPMLIDFPGAEDTGRRFSELVSTLDIAPTILDFANAEIPTYMSGSSLRELNENTTDNQWRQELFLMYEKAQAAVRTDDYKLIKSLEVEGHYELYDLVNDPKETRSVYADASYEQVRVDMHRRLKAITTENGWTPRKSYPISTIQVSDPIATQDAAALASYYSSFTLDEFLNQAPNPALSWRSETRDPDNEDNLFTLRDDPTTEHGESVLVAIPISRMSGWDPFIDFTANRILSRNNFFSSTIYVDGQEVWSNRTVLPLNAPNPPLQDKETLVVLQFDDTGDLALSLSLEAPEDTIYLPLENRLLGNAPQRFSQIDSWHGNASTNITKGANEISISSIDNSTAMLLTTDNIYLNEPATLRVQYRAPQDTTLNAHWRSEYNTFSDTEFASASLLGDNQSQTLELLIDSADDIDSLRLEVPAEASGLVIENISLTTLSGDVVHEWSYQDNETLSFAPQVSPDALSFTNTD